ncbi:MAG TPA: hypothetical protein ENI74_00810 [Gammaproteobacteria bacterium]|nr:hypothetical protein [Gammaproteobacteria bacterium]
MQTAAATGGRGKQKNRWALLIRKAAILFPLLFCMPAYASCVDEPGLNPVQVIEAANKQQIRILKAIKSKESVKKMIPLLKECKDQKRKVNLDMIYDPRIWARTAAKGNREKEKTFLGQIDAMKKSYPRVYEQISRIRKEIPGVDAAPLLKNIESPIVAEQIKNPDHLLVGRWFLLEDRPARGYKIIASELNFMGNGLAVIDRYALGESVRATQSGNPGIQIMKWAITDATRRIPFEVSMKKTIDELKDYIYVRVLVWYVDGKPKQFKYGKTDIARYLGKAKQMRFLLKADGTAMVLPNPHSRMRDEAPFFARYISGAELPEKTAGYMKQWKENIQHYVDTEKKNVSGLCKKWDDASIVNPYCKKFLSVLNGISVKIKKRALNSEQKILGDVASQYLFQPIKDYSDASPVPTSLSYEPLPAHVCKADKEAWHKERQAEGFSNTLWSMWVQRRKIKAGPDDNKREFLRYAKALAVWNGSTITLDGDVLTTKDLRQIIHLRKDGVFGLSWSPSYGTVEEPIIGGPTGRMDVIRFDAGKDKPRMYYDPANHWRYDGKRVNLFWNNGKQPYPMRGTAKYEALRGSIIKNYEELYHAVLQYAPETDRKTWKTPAYAGLSKAYAAESKAYQEAKKTGRCGRLGKESPGKAAALPTAPPGSGPDAAPSGKRENGVVQNALQPGAPKISAKAAAWQTVGLWDYDGVDAQHLAQGFVLREKPGSGLGQTWKAHLELKNHKALTPRQRTLWPVMMNTGIKKVCANYPGYPTYPVFIDMPGEKNDGIYLVSYCNGGASK